jgi:hypothetical protein
VQDVLDAIRTREPTTDLDGFPAVPILVGRSLTVDLDHPTASGRNHVDVLVHRFPLFKVGRPQITSLTAIPDGPEA